MGHLPGKRLSLEATASFTPLLGLLLFDILTLILTLTDFWVALLPVCLSKHHL